MKKPKRLGEFIVTEMECILEGWETFATTVNPSLMLNRKALRDHAEQMLRTIAQDLTMRQSPEKQAEKSKGHGPRTQSRTAAEEHAQGRLSSGFTVEQLFSEYRALRASVLSLGKAIPRKD